MATFICGRRRSANPVAKVLRVRSCSCNRHRKLQESLGKGYRRVLLGIQYILVENVVVIQRIVIELGTYNIYRSTECKERIGFRILRMRPVDSIGTVLV